MKHSPSARRLALGLCVAIAFFISTGGIAQASCGATWVGGSGDWSTASNWSPATVPGNQSGDETTVCIGNGATVTLNYETTDVSLSLTGGSSLDIWGQSGYTHGGLTLTSQGSGSGIAAGSSVVLGYSGSPSDNAYQTHGAFYVNSGTLVSNGTITSANTGDETPNEIEGNFDNAGTLTINGNMINSNAGTWINTGTINIASGQELQTGGSSFSFSEPSGTIENSGSFDETSGTLFAITGSGTTSGDGLSEDAANLELSSSGSGSVDSNAGAGEITGNIASGWTLKAFGEAAYDNGDLTTNGAVTNYGKIILGDSSSQTNATINATGGTFTNDGTITSEDVNPQYTSGNGETSNVINGAFVNNGTLDVDDGLVGTPSSWTLGGTVNIPSGQTVSLSGPGSGNATATFSGTVNNSGSFTLGNGITVVAAAGTESGNPIELAAGPLDAAGSGKGTFHIMSGSGQLGSNIADGYTVWASGIPGYSHGNLTPLGSYTNYGTLELGSTDGTHGTLTVPSGLTLTNDGTLIFEATGNGGDGLSGTLVNNGSVSAQNNFSGAGAITNDGKFELTAASGENQAASFSQGAKGTLQVDVTGGKSPVIPSIQLSGKAKAAGTLSVSTSKGSAKGSFPVLTSAGVGGRFATNFSGEYYSVAYKAGTVSLTGPAAAPKVPAISGISGGHASLSVKLKCAKGKACAGYTVAVTTRQKTKVNGKHKSVTVTIAEKHGAIKAGESAIVRVSLNSAGRSLLKHHASVKVLVTITAGGRTIRSATVKITRG